MLMSLENFMSQTQTTNSAQVTASALANILGVTVKGKSSLTLITPAVHASKVASERVGSSRLIDLCDPRTTGFIAGFIAKHVMADPGLTADEREARRDEIVQVLVNVGAISAE